MNQVTRSVGPIEVTALLDCDFPAGPMLESFPDAPADELLAAKASYPDVYTPDDQWRLRVRAWLIRHVDGLLLLDTGIGGATSPSQAWAPVPGTLPSALEAIGVGTDHIDTVAISHVHDDHIGGLLVDDGTPTFPNARYLLQRADLEWQREMGRENEEDAAIWRLLEPLEAGGLLDVIDGDTRISGALELHHLPGHTPGHQVLRIESDDRRMILCADTWNHPAQFAQPDWPSGADNHHTQAAASRRRLLAELLSHPGTVIAPTHLDASFGEVRSGRDGLAAWVPTD